MAWRFEPGEALPDAFRRVAAEEISLVRADLGALDEDPEKAIHQARRRFKRLRALLRLARPSLGRQFAGQNRRWRDFGRKLAGERDAVVLAATFDAVAERCGHALRSEHLDRLRRSLNDGERPGAGAHADGGADDLPGLVQGVLADLDEAEADVAQLSWPCSREDLAEGLRQSQARLRQSWKAARDGSDPEAPHEWRKRVKDQMAQLGLFRKVVPDKVKARREEEKRLAEVLGEERDLLLLCRKLAGPGPRGTKTARDVLLKEIAARREALRSDALAAGEALASQPAKAFAKQLAAAWKAAGRRDAPQPRRRKLRTGAPA